MLRLQGWGKKMKRLLILLAIGVVLAGCADVEIARMQQFNAAAEAHNNAILANFDKLTPEQQCNFLRQRLMGVLTDPWNANNPELKQFAIAEYRKRCG
jgi:hypothetical protein